MPKIGIIGGTFNPVHNAHLGIAEHFIEQMQLDKCYFVPAALSPFKTEDESANLISSEHRIEMLKLAIKANPKLDVDTFEIEQGGVSWTINTVKYFREQFPDAELFLLIGGDHALVFTQWGKWQEILELVTLCIARRPGIISKEREKEINKTLTINNKVPIWLDTPLIDISASEIRERVRRNEPINTFVSKAVQEYIFYHNLYSNKN
jgi:nicotinate-nucleotide adenylyltransferase